LHLKATQRSSDPKKIAQVITSFLSNCHMHNKIMGLEGEKRFGYCKKKIDIMIGSLVDFHCLNKINSFGAMIIKSYNGVGKNYDGIFKI
jgi:hypothetical protein